MEFAINSFSSRVDHFKSVAAVAVHMTVAGRCASATEQKWYLMCGLGSKTQEVPEHIRILVKHTQLAETRDSHNTFIKSYHQKSVTIHSSQWAVGADVSQVYYH